MIQSRCVVQDGQISAQTETALRISLAAFSQRAFGAPVQIDWVTVPAESGFTAGEPSTSSIVVMRANAPLEQPQRITLLREICDLWMAETQCSINEIVAIISDPETH